MGRRLGFLVVLLLLLAACGSPNPPPAGTPDIISADGRPAVEEAPVDTELAPIASSTANESRLVPTAQPAVTATGQMMTDATTYPAEDERIRYIGRFDFQDPASPEFDWSGTAIEVAFEGTDLAIFLEELDGINVYNVIVDGRSHLLKTEKGPGRYVLATGLPPGEHHVRLVKRTEPVLGAVLFSGLEIAGGGLLDRPAAKARRIEFIGDSITTGFGNEGDSPECSFSLETQNAETAYAALVAAELDADYALIAMSGLGVYHPLQLQGVSSSDTALDIVDRALAFEPDIIWPPDQQTPDAVVISLGTNDYSVDPVPEDEAYITAYMELLEAVRGRYPQAHIFAVAGPLVIEPGPQMIETAVERFRAAGSDKRVSYIIIEDNLERSAKDFGCAWHPNVNGHRKIAAQLTPAIAAHLGW